ncbi:MAG: Fe-S oxidoreductase, partial [Chloroflexi bacterium]
MGKLTSKQETWLRERFDSRFSADLTERKIYSHDVGVMPPLVKPLLGKAVADGIVQPQDEEEVIELVRWAVQNHVPLIPRGKATSGYGGVLPVKGGITVNSWHMRDILAVDEESLTVTVGPGAIWEKLEQELNKQELALCLYPSSAPSSTVGGWLAQGGFGYGSFEYASFPENVLSARVVLPGGEAREFTGDDLDLIADAEGITGFITQITLRVRPLEQEMVVGGRFADVGGLATALRTVVKEQLPLWSVTFINPEMARLKNQLPPKLEHGHPADEQRPKLPTGYLAV